MILSISGNAFNEVGGSERRETSATAPHLRSSSSFSSSVLKQELATCLHSFRSHTTNTCTQGPYNGVRPFSDFWELRPTEKAIRLLA